MGVCVLGSINLDIVCGVPRIPVAGETMMADSLRRFAGGKGANQAAASAAWGAPTALIGAVGEDDAGDFLIAHLARAGVDTAAVARVAAAPTGQAHICVSHAGENMIVVVGGANQALTPLHIAQANLSGHRLFLAQLETPLDAIEAFFAHPAARGGVTLLNAAPAAPAARALFPLADIIVVNQGELGLYADAPAPTAGQDAIALARGLISRPDQTVIVTLGAAGALAVTAKSHDTVEGRPARVVDTTGAGDCFCGVLAATLSEGADLPQALRWANAAAALSTEHAGAAVAPGLRAEAERRL